MKREDMRNEITYYLIRLAQPWTAKAPGGMMLKAGTLIYQGEGKLPRGGFGQAGWTAEGWLRILGHGMSEIIPTSHLNVSRRRFVLGDHLDLSWDDACPTLTGR